MGGGSSLRAPSPQAWVVRKEGASGAGVNGINMDKIDEISTGKYRIWLQEGIARGAWSPNTTITFDDAKATLDTLVRLSGGRRLPLLVDATEVVSITREARQCYSKSAQARAVALFVTSPLSRIIANFSVSLGRPLIPIKVFDDETEALKWLRGFLE